jgi:hypothetical protein
VVPIEQDLEFADIGFQAEPTLPDRMAVVCANWVLGSQIHVQREAVALRRCSEIVLVCRYEQLLGREFLNTTDVFAKRVDQAIPRSVHTRYATVKLGT